MCRMHGAGAPAVRARAAERVAELDALAAFGKLKIQPVENPLAELSLLAGEVLAWKQVMAERVTNLQALRYQGMAGEQIRAEVVLFERAMDRCVSVLGVIARLNIDERLMQISRVQGQTIVSILHAVFADLELSPSQAATAHLSVPSRIREITSGPSPVSTGRIFPGRTV